MNKLKITLALALFSLIALSLISALDYTGGVTDFTGTRIVDFYTSNWSCISTPTTATWYNFQTKELVDATLNCTKHATDYVKSCCPELQSCDIVTNKCSAISEAKGCSKYNNSAACGLGTIADVQASAIDNPGRCIRPADDWPEVIIAGNKCWNVTKCECAWVDNKCKPRVSFNYPCKNGSMGTWGYCTWDITDYENNCDNEKNNIISFAKVTIWGKDQNCTDVRSELPCPSTAKLGFFSFFNLISAILVIAIVYMLVLHKKHL